MDISEQLEDAEYNERFRMAERGSFWNPTTTQRRKAYYEWLVKQAKQQRKTLELSGVTHGRSMKDALLRREQMYIEEAKRIKDLIEDGK